MAPSILILIPAYNEEDRLGPVLDGVREHAPEAEVLVIDDGSTDGTGDVARARGTHVVVHPFNLGYGSALQTGYHFARRHAFDRTVQMDADGQHEPRSIPTLLAALAGGADVVVGSRYRVAGDAPRTSLMRRTASRCLSWLVTRWTRIRISDPTSGFQAVSSRAVDEFVRDSFPEDYPDADVLIAAVRSGLNLCEVPVTMHPRLGGVSMHRGSRAAYYGYKMTMSLLLLPVRRASPFRSGQKPLPARTS